MIVNISYQTLLLPPPFAFAYTLKMDFQETEIRIKYDLEFLNRDEITLDEIEAEGYSKNDDYSWQGTLGKEWIDDLKNDLSQIELEEESDDINIYLYAEIKFDDGESDSGQVLLAEDWDYRLQELIQAIYEKDGIEEKLKMTCINIEQGKSEPFELTGSFEHRTASINNRPVEWDLFHELVADIYTMEFEDEAVNKPSEDGLWIDPDGKSGYQRFEDQAGPKSDDIKSRIMNVLRLG